MKKLFPIIVTALVGLFCFPVAKAYDQRVADFSNAFTEAAEGAIYSTYDGSKLILTFPASFFSETEKAAFSGVDNLDEFKPEFLSVLKATMGGQLSLLGELLAHDNTKLVVRLKLNKVIDIVFTPQELLNAK